MMNKSYLYCLITIIFFSTYEVVGKFISPYVSPSAITSIRFFIGGIALLPFALNQKRKFNISLNFKDFLIISFPGFLNVTVSMLFLQLSVHYGKAALAAMLVSTNPLFVAIFAFFILKEKTSYKKIIGLIIGLIGMTMVVFNEKGIFDNTENISLGVIYGMAASVVFALYTVFSKKYIFRYKTLLFNSLSFIVGSLLLAFLSFVFRKPFIFVVNSTSIIGTLYLSLVITGFAYILFFEGLKNIPTVHGSMFFYFKPLIAAFLAYIFLNETLHWTQFLGFLIVIGGLNLERVKFKKNS